jgi:hypothetical protein
LASIRDAVILVAAILAILHPVIVTAATVVRVTGVVMDATVVMAAVMDAIAVVTRPGDTVLSPVRPMKLFLPTIRAATPSE